MNKFQVISSSTSNKQGLSELNDNTVCVFQAISDLASWDCTDLAQGSSETKQNSAVKGQALRTHLGLGCYFYGKRRKTGLGWGVLGELCRTGFTSPPATRGRLE